MCKHFTRQKSNNNLVESFKAITNKENFGEVEGTIHRKISVLFAYSIDVRLNDSRVMTSTESCKGDVRPVFKATTFQHTSKSNNKKRAWKSLKQIISAERSLPWPDDYVHYSSINAPPSFKPAEKFSDLSGLPAFYTDPQSRLRFATKEEYVTLIGLPMDITAGYLALRGASSIVG